MKYHLHLTQGLIGLLILVLEIFMVGRAPPSERKLIRLEPSAFDVVNKTDPFECSLTLVKVSILNSFVNAICFTWTWFVTITQWYGGIWPSSFFSAVNAWFRFRRQQPQVTDQNWSKLIKQSGSACETSAENYVHSSESKPDMFRIADKVFSCICSFVDVVAKS